jgi:hypothetical protein
MTLHTPKQRTLFPLWMVAFVVLMAATVALSIIASRTFLDTRSQRFALHHDEVVSCYQRAQSELARQRIVKILVLIADRQHEITMAIPNLSKSDRMSLVPQLLHIYREQKAGPQLADCDRIAQLYGFPIER